jgi:hypothetical protein
VEDELMGYLMGNKINMEEELIKSLESQIRELKASDYTGEALDQMVEFYVSLCTKFIASTAEEDGK